MSPGRPAATARRRLAAFAVDYLLIAAWIGVLLAASLTVTVVLHLPLELARSDQDKIVGHLIAFLFLTLPVALYFAVSEWSPWQATPGKRALHIRVETLGGDRLSFGRSVLRSGLKFAPWELAHTAIWHVPGQLFVSQPPLLNQLGYAVSLAVAAAYVASLFVRSGRTPYDRAAGSYIKRVSD